MSGLFSDLSFNFEITNDKDIKDYTISETKDNDVILDLNISLDALNNKPKSPLKSIGVLNRTNIKTNNSFINAVQSNENKKVDAEIKRIEKSDNEFPYIRTKLMTDAEQQLYHFMINNLDCRNKIAIFPKVRLADLIEVDPKLSLDKKYFYKISSKHVDYVICKNDTLEIICVVELDDFYHDRDDKKERDIFVMQALYTVSIDVIRIKVPIKTICKDDLDFLDTKINTVLAPPCPYCGIKMTPKKSMHASNRGHRFYSCPNFISGCRYTINIDQEGEELP